MIKEVRNVSNDLLNQSRQSVKEAMEAVKSADIDILEDDSGSGSISIVSKIRSKYAEAATN